MRRIVAGLVEAIDRTQAVMEFNPDETMLTANDNFLATVGYQLEEIKGNTTGCSAIRPTRPAGTMQRFGRRSIAGSAMRTSGESVHQSGKRLDEIVTTVKRVTDIIGEISAASQEAGERDRPGEQGHRALPPATAPLPPQEIQSYVPIERLPSNNRGAIAAAIVMSRALLNSRPFPCRLGSLWTSRSLCIRASH